MNTEKIKLLVSNFEQEIAIMKGIVENCSLHGEEFVPMIVFYSDPETKTIVVAPHAHGTFVDKMRSVGEAMMLYSSIDAHACIVSLPSKMNLDDKDYDVLSMFIMSNFDAHIIYLPYTVENQTVIWHEELQTSSPLDDAELDGVGKDMSSMFNLYITTSTGVFTTPEILSYLSTTGAAISQFNTKYQYIDMSELGEVNAGG